MISVRKYLEPPLGKMLDAGCICPPSPVTVSGNVKVGELRELVGAAEEDPEKELNRL